MNALALTPFVLVSLAVLEFMTASFQVHFNGVYYHDVSCLSRLPCPTLSHYYPLRTLILMLNELLFIFCLTVFGVGSFLVKGYILLLHFIQVHCYVVLYHGIHYPTFISHTLCPHFPTAMVKEFRRLIGKLPMNLGI